MPINNRGARGRNQPIPRNVQRSIIARVQCFDKLLLCLFIIGSNDDYIPCSQKDGLVRDLYVGVIADCYQLNLRKREQCIKMLLERESVRTGVTKTIVRSRRGSISFPNRTKKISIVMGYCFPEYLPNSIAIQKLGTWVDDAGDDGLLREGMSSQQAMQFGARIIMRYDHSRHLYAGFPTFIPSPSHNPQPDPSTPRPGLDIRQSSQRTVSNSPADQSLLGHNVALSGRGEAAVRNATIMRNNGESNDSIDSPVAEDIIESTDVSQVEQEKRLKEASLDTSMYLLMRKILSEDSLDVHTISAAAVLEYTRDKPLLLRSKFETTLLTFALRKDVESESYTAQFNMFVELCRIMVNHRRDEGRELYASPSQGYWNVQWNTTVLSSM